MKFHLALVAALSFLLAGCGGTMQGVVRGEGTPVQIHYEQGIDRDTYRTNIDGESFAGQAVNAGATTGVGTVFGGGNTATVISSTTSGNFVAVLLGNRGSTMRCQMNYADSSGLTSLGGVGVCHHSDGRVIDITW
ncbi:hypothetical protein DSM14862_00274 [Sulfitobacter indolifex]|uniref:Lipoprotein n=1 Tax=Sulfitobacter indolifex HEL-45 TaxID=391624 RepID=A0ABM9XAG6_9RHOB|nr:hypothetical protein OIHEL45_06940 [Sulfitobacter indolifex HEL-45]UOA17524.1 hypothetical protein DSM14862_00274 [Sulfitobacter indolifex]